MKKLFFALLLFCGLCLPALAQTYTRLGATQVIYTTDNKPDTRAYLTVFKVVYAGRPVSLTPKTYRTDSSGYLVGDDGQRGIRLLSGAQVWLYSPITLIPGISRNPQAGTQYTVPASSATQLEELIYALTLFGSKGDFLVGGPNGKPSTLAAGANGYVLTADNTQPLGVKWAAPTGGGGGGTWGSITGTLSNQTDLQAALEAKQPLDADLTSIAALSTTSFGRGLLTESSASTARSTLGLVIGTNVQMYNSDLAAIAGLTPTNDDILQRKAGAWTNRTVAQFKTDLSLTKSDVGLGSVENTALSTWAGSANITTLGTIATGTWQGSVIGSAYGGAGAVNGILRANGSGTVAAVTIGSGLSFDGTTLSASGGGGSPGGSGSELQFRGGASTFGAVTNSSVSGANIALQGTLTQTVSSATALVVGPNGTTNPTLTVATNTASAATGVSITSAAAGSGVVIAATSSGSNEAMEWRGKGTGVVRIYGGSLNRFIQFHDGNATTAGDASYGAFVSPKFSLQSTGSVLSGAWVQGTSYLLLNSSHTIGWLSITNVGGGESGGDLEIKRAAAGVLRIGATTGTGTLSSTANSPAQITADQNNYAPGVGWFQRWSSDASRTVTGLSAGQDGQIIEIWNVGSNNIVLTHQSASSTAANRFLNNTGADLTIAADRCAIGRYDNTTQRWRMRLCN